MDEIYEYIEVEVELQIEVTIKYFSKCIMT